MVKYKIEKLGPLYYARRYSDSGMLLDSLASGSKKKAERVLRIMKKG